jgi:PPOX class probable F420-dependent enzyme
MPSLNPAAMRRLVEAARVARLATVDAAGRPHLVPVCFVLESDGSGDRADRVHIAVDHKPKRSVELRRTANLQATGRASLLIDHYDEDWSRLWWVRLDGHAAQVRDPDQASRAIDALAAKYPQYREHRPDGPVLTIEIEAYRGWAATEPAATEPAATDPA